MSHRLPLFPLDVVLFPGALLPLHIFEPRYRAMLADCLSGDHRFGLLPPPPEGEARPPTGAIGTTALVRATQPLEDGRSHVVVSGEARFVLRRYLDEGTQYSVGLVDPYEDDPEDLEDARPHVGALQSLAGRGQDALKELIDLGETADWSNDPARLTFQIAGMLQVDGAFKRRFLAMRSAAHRAVLLLQLLPRIVHELEERAAVHRRAGSNGAGGAAPDIEYGS